MVLNQFYWTKSLSKARFASLARSERKANEDYLWVVGEFGILSRGIFQEITGFGRRVLPSLFECHGEFDIPADHRERGQVGLGVRKYQQPDGRGPGDFRLAFQGTSLASVLKPALQKEHRRARHMLRPRLESFQNLRPRVPAMWTRYFSTLISLDRSAGK